VTEKYPFPMEVLDFITDGNENKRLKRSQAKMIVDVVFKYIELREYYLKNELFNQNVEEWGRKFESLKQVYKEEDNEEPLNFTSAFVD
jgi:hypothetical protein